MVVSVVIAKKRAVEYSQRVTPLLDGTASVCIKLTQTSPTKPAIVFIIDPAGVEWLMLDGVEVVAKKETRTNV